MPAYSRFLPLLFLIGCASSAPLSEMLTHYEGQQLNLTHLGLNVDHSKEDVDSWMRHETEQHPRFREIGRSNTKYPTILTIGGTSIMDRFAVNGSFGVPWVASVDVTAHIGFRVYTTARMSIPSNHEFILQKTIYHSGWLTINAGWATRTDSYVMEYARRPRNPDGIQIHLMRLRSTVNRKLTTSGPRLSITGPYVYGYMYYGYQSSEAFPSVQLAIGVPFRR